MHEIRLAQKSDRAALIQFIDQHWKKNHIFVTSDEIFDWQHFDRISGKYNFIIGVERATQAIHGVLGFIPLAHFDSEIPFERLCWMAIWMTQDAARGHKLGRRLLSYLEESVKPDVISTVGASEMTLAMYQARGYQTGRLSQYYILNSEQSNFSLIAVKDTKRIPDKAGTSDANKRLQPAFENDIIADTENCFRAQIDFPPKSPRYLINRYLRHPVYHYQIYLIRDRSETTGIVVTRICSHAGAKAIRIVDFIGPSDALSGLCDEWNYLLKSTNAEYIDFYNQGIDDNHLRASGFVRREMGDAIIVPNYFEPFFKANVEIDYCISLPPGQAYRIVKGDSDQDRPAQNATSMF
ncbi:hypothetical protein [Bradyrhizobium sp. 21]|uniref:hypothetical protein n=1 Tax=Bradyrhizobium sp. 21 TaxID=2782666 RepID=UPI001FF87D44|nr:hypothetical protein [Bradyrhizobium sp. 21]MCK1383478.1 hypothetical protein [Bradyrhizobium sp. 21]